MSLCRNLYLVCLQDQYWDFVFLPYLAQVIQKKSPTTLPATKEKEIAMPQNNSQPILWCLIGIIALFFLILLVFGLASFFHNFSEELKYIKIEIRRNTGAERKYWIRQKHRLWLSLIPFIKYKQSSNFLTQPPFLPSLLEWAAIKEHKCRLRRQ